MLINPEMLAVSVTLDSVVLGKQRYFPIKFIMALSSFFHVTAFGFGLFLGEQLIGLIGHFDHWVSFAVFGLLGVSCYKVILLPDKKDQIELKSMPKLLLAVFALSIDAAAVGASSKGLIEEPLYVLASIGLLSPAFIFVGSLAKVWLTTRNDNLLKFIEGSLFVSIGAMIVFSHISGGF
jgi:putative Mn2+ efflux pump MntP